MTNYDRLDCRRLRFKRSVWRRATERDLAGDSGVGNWYISCLLGAPAAIRYTVARYYGKVVWPSIQRLESYLIGYWLLAIVHCYSGRNEFLPCFSMTNTRYPISNTIYILSKYRLRSQSVTAE